MAQQTCAANLETSSCPDFSAGWDFRRRLAGVHGLTARSRFHFGTKTPCLCGLVTAIFAGRHHDSPSLPRCGRCLKHMHLPFFAGSFPTHWQHFLHKRTAQPKRRFLWRRLRAVGQIEASLRARHLAKLISSSGAGSPCSWRDLHRVFAM